MLAWWGWWHHSRSGSSLLLSIMMFRAICTPVPKICSIAFVRVSCEYHHGKWNLDSFQMIERAEEKMGRGSVVRWWKQKATAWRPHTIWSGNSRSVINGFGHKWGLLVCGRMFNYVSDDRAVRRFFYEKQCVELWAVKYNWELRICKFWSECVGGSGNIVFTTTNTNKVNWKIKWVKNKQMRLETRADKTIRNKKTDQTRQEEIRRKQIWWEKTRSKDDMKKLGKKHQRRVKKRADETRRRETRTTENRWDEKGRKENIWYKNETRKQKKPMWMKIY